MTEKLLTTAEVCSLCNVTRWTLKKWEETGELIPITKTSGGHRRYRQSDVYRLMGASAATENADITAVYCRVSSHEQKQKGDLDRQKARVLEHCLKKRYVVDHVFTEVGSGMNDGRPKLKCLFDLVRSRLINRIVIEHKDRLTRFNFAYLDAFFSSHGVVIECMEDVLPKSYENELVEDILSLMASFSAKIYGKRSAEHRKNHLRVVGGDSK
jgi:putative resolvase